MSNRAPPLISDSEFETVRTAAEMLPWALVVYERFLASKELKKAAREGKIGAGKLLGEYLPIARFADRYFDKSSAVLISFLVGNQPYDAVVDDRRIPPGVIRYIEATVSDMSYEESLRMELLSKHGSVPAFGRIRSEGPKGRRIVLEAERIAVRHDTLRETHLAAVTLAVEKKAASSYPVGTAIVVRVDDATPFREPEDVAALDALAVETLLPMLRNREFRVLAFVGSLGLYRCYSV